GMDKKSYGYGTGADWGCYLVAMAIQIARSGAKDNFDPWDFIEHMYKNGYMNNAMVANDSGGVSSFTDGKFRFQANGRMEVPTGTSRAKIAETLKVALDAGYYPIVRLDYGPSPSGEGRNTHFVAIDRVEGDKVYMFDPGYHANELFAKHGDRVDQIRIFESDVPSTVANGPNSSSEGITEEDKEKLNLNAFKWDEGKIDGMPKPVEWEEEPIPVTNLSDLEDHQKDSIAKWKEEIKQRNNADLVTINRVISMLLGMAMLLFSLVYLVSFVF